MFISEFVQIHSNGDKIHLDNNSFHEVRASHRIIHQFHSFCLYASYPGQEGDRIHKTALNITEDEAPVEQRKVRFLLCSRIAVLSSHQQMAFLVQGEVIRAREGAITVRALERLYSCVFPKVTGQLIRAGKLPRTAFPHALVRFLS